MLKLHFKLFQYSLYSFGHFSYLEEPWTGSSDLDTKEAKYFGGFNQNEVKVSQNLGANWSDASAGLQIDTSATATISSYHYRAMTEGPNYLVIVSTDGDFYKLPQGETIWQSMTVNPHYDDWLLTRIILPELPAPLSLIPVTQATGFLPTGMVCTNRQIAELIGMLPLMGSKSPSSIPWYETHHRLAGF